MSDAKRPSNWTTARLGDLCEVVRGVSFPSSEKSLSAGPGLIACLRTANVQDKVEWDDLWFIPEHRVRIPEQLVRPDDILISTANSKELVGKVARIDALTTPSTLGAFISAIRPTSGIDSKYLYSILRSSAIQSSIRETASTTTNISNLSMTRVLDIEIPVAPAGEQGRIATKTDELLSDLEAGVGALDRARANLRRYRAAVLKAAVEGRLTEKWRAAHPAVEPASKLLERTLTERKKKWEEAQLKKFADKGQAPPKGWKEKYLEPVTPDVAKLPELPPGWCWMALDQLADIGTGATPLRSEQRYWREGSIAWVTSAAVNEPYVHEASELVTPAALAETNLLVYPKHTLILAMYGEGKTRGKVSELLIEATTNQALAALVFDGSSSSCRQYVKTYLAKSYEDMRRIAAGGVQPNLNLGLIREMSVPIPPLAEQAEIEAMVDRVLSVQQQLVDESWKSALRGARLRQAILKRAFEGRLVQQDPKDEPASELLARIRAEREKRAAGVSHKRGSRRRSGAV